MTTNATTPTTCPDGCGEVIRVFRDGSYARPECGTLLPVASA